MYNENDDQLFIKLDPDQDPIEFLVAEQPLELIRANIVTKDEIRKTVENGFYAEGAYSKTFTMQGFSVAMNVFVIIDDFLRIVINVESYFTKDSKWKMSIIN